VQISQRPAKPAAARTPRRPAVAARASSPNSAPPATPRTSPRFQVERRALPRRI
jgi:hypothetical protein